ncbi:hypothetical protein WJX75_003556 [Coccomyxa subellipsoidea]|uniref:TPX2 C-terminal domain-containing protein n=1 Tax=Coccomyxa subellipsoidea TaxID=248742 RepID=A0ABR2YT11_9CHLO
MPVHIPSRHQKETIMQMKLRQDLELRAAEEAAHRFRAHHLPKTTSQPRYARILAQQAERLRTSHEHSRRVLEQLEEPFSFYERDKERTAAASAAAAALAEQEAATPQAAFKATPVPAFIKKRAQKFRVQQQQRQALAALQQNLQTPALRRQPRQKLPPIPPPQHAQGSAVDQWAMGAEQQPAVTPPKSWLPQRQQYTNISQCLRNLGSQQPGSVR